MLQRASNSGWHLVLGNIFATLQPTRLPTNLITPLHLPYLHSTHSRDAIRCLVSMGKARRLRWTPGRVFQKSPLCLSPCPELKQIAEEWMLTPECFVVLLYERTSSSSSVNDTTKQLFTHKARNFDALPPTQDSLPNMSSVLHKMLATSGDKPSCQTHLFLAHKIGMDIGKWGVVAFWTTLSEITKSCQKLVKCGCKKGCTGGCGCQKVSLRCTAMCKCAEEYENR